MPMNDLYAKVEPTRAQIDALSGPALLEFGAPWCSHCMVVQPMLAAALASHPLIPHIKIEDGKGRRLGRSFTVKLWPTLIFLQDGKEVSRLVRPENSTLIGEALSQLG